MFPGGGWESFQRANPEDFAAFLAGQFPFGRLGSLPEVADVVAFLLSERASGSPARTSPWTAARATRAPAASAEAANPTDGQVMIRMTPEQWLTRDYSQG